jgi:hypothetical protein
MGWMINGVFLGKNAYDNKLLNRFYTRTNALVSLGPYCLIGCNYINWTLFLINDRLFECANLKRRRLGNLINLRNYT